VELDDLPDGERLWWTFASRAALDRASGADGWGFDPEQRVLRHDLDDGTRVRMQRLYNGRFVLWGTAADTAPRPSWSGLPGWVSSDAVHRWFDEVGGTFIAWHARDGWDTATPEADVVGPVQPLLADDLPEGLIDAAVRADSEALRAIVPGDADAALEILQAARANTVPVQGRVRALLATEIRAQMRTSPERDRVLPQRPVMLVRWVRVAVPVRGFTFMTYADRAGLREVPRNHRLPDQFRTSLVNLLAQLHREEGDADSGHWLFARVRFDGINVHFDRCFDSRPSWFTHEGPSLEALSAEMSRRTPTWRPAWARLLP
jgi:hypothetical protein